MHPLQLRERVNRPQVKEGFKPVTPAKSSIPMGRPLRFETVSQRPTTTVNTHQPVRIKVQERIAQKQQDTRVQHELKEMQETDDLRNIDDDVEDLATLYEWHAEQHNHRPKSPAWFITLAVGVTVVAGVLVFMKNILGAITIAFAGGFMYYTAQHKPAVARYRILVDGIAINNLLYHYRDLAAFNIVYEPGHVKTAIFRSKHLFSPFIHMEVGDADPVAIRDILLEFIPEDQEMDEPLADILARRLGF